MAEDNKQQLRTSLRNCLDTISSSIALTSEHLFVAGTSTSEVVGERIGSAGSEEAAAALYEEFADFQRKTGVHMAFQCCEHLNRALVVERKTAQQFGLEEVTAIPHRKAGGAMAEYVYEHMTDPVLVEHVRADAGIDIGDTMIGMHLKHVAIPLRSEQKTIGSAHVSMARTRPKLIGGVRAKYPTT
ncbi:TIGR01440 family protein [Bacillus piscicola]|uniref:TIGR01440 family protein n=1 Tax=Bacillus piscicola TaxID=1632684 RepID=UPI001F08A960|nr:TIGR01440 family protein [Bacillus piscicola]